MFISCLCLWPHELKLTHFWCLQGYSEGKGKWTFTLMSLRQSFVWILLIRSETRKKHIDNYKDIHKQSVNKEQMETLTVLMNQGPGIINVNFQKLLKFLLVTGQQIWMSFSCFPVGSMIWADLRSSRVREIPSGLTLRVGLLLAYSFVNYSIPLSLIFLICIVQQNDRSVCFAYVPMLL